MASQQLEFALVLQIQETAKFLKSHILFLIKLTLYVLEGRDSETLSMYAVQNLS